MKKIFLSAISFFLVANASAAELKWNGSAGFRHSFRTQDDSLGSASVAAATLEKDVSRQSIRAYHLRANLGVTGALNEVEYGFGLRTSSGVANSDWVTLTGADLVFALEQAWLRYGWKLDDVQVSLTVGRQKSALITDTQWDTLYSKLTRWNGLGWNVKFGAFGLNASQYVTGAKSQGVSQASTYTETEATEAVAGTQSRIFWVWAVQPYVNWKLAEDMEAVFAVAYTKWVDESQTNGTGGNYNSNTLNGTTGSRPALANSSFAMHNKGQWDFLTVWSLPHNLSFTGEFIVANKARYDRFSVPSFNTTAAISAGNPVEPEVGNKAFNLGLTYGKLKKARDFSVGYAYGSKDIGSVINAYSYARFPADNKGHIVSLGYSVADNFNLGFRLVSLEEKEHINVAAATSAAGLGSAYSGANALQSEKSVYWEITSGVSF